MKLVLVTGAGASRNLGQEDGHMPLMPDWSDALCGALDAAEPNLAQACHLTRGASGPDFEENLGLLLRWQQVRHLEERFAGLGGPQAGSVFGPQKDARQNTARRMGMVVEALNRTLYDQFGQRRIDDEKARLAYSALLHQLGEPELVVATTNYDRSVEAAFAKDLVRTGFVSQPGRTPILQPVGMTSDPGSTRVVIHLHGAVGWYERDGQVEDHYADQPYNPTLGTPVVLYPDPEKDPTSDAIVNQLWIEFRAALDWADQVLVVGHSLHDPALVRELQVAARTTRIAVSYFSDSGRERVGTIFPEATPIAIDFGPEPAMDQDALSKMATA
jgi:hypothetical protein